MPKFTEVRNYGSPDKIYTITCPKCNKKAEVLLHYKVYKNPLDVAPTYTFSGHKCSLSPDVFCADPECVSTKF